MTDRFICARSSRASKILAVCLLAMLIACAEADPNQFVQEGKALFQKGDMEGARVQFKNALQANPKLAEAHYGLALLDEKKPDLAAMRKTLQEVVALDPNHVDAQAKLGLLLVDQLDKAKLQLAIVQKLAPDNINTLLLEGKIQFAENNKAGAMHQIERVLAKDEANPDAIWLQATIFLADKRYEDALTTLNRGAEAHPENLALGLLKIRAHKEQQKFDDVVRDYAELVAKHPDDKRLRNDQLMTLTKIGKLDQAEQALYDAISKDSADIDLKLTLANFIELRDPARAEKTLKEFIAASPKDIKLKSRLAGYYIGHQRMADAQALLAEIVAADPAGKDGLMAKVHQAELAWGQGDKANAERLAEEVINVDAGNGNALLFRARTRLAQQDMEGAISDLRIVLRDQPNSDQAMIIMAQAYAMKGEPEVAESHWRKALSVNPANLAAIGPLTSLMLKRGDAARAEDLLTKSLSSNPNNPPVLELLIKLRAEQKNWAGAEAALNELKKQPQAALAAQMLEATLAASQGRHQEAVQAYKKVLTEKPGYAEALLGMARADEAAGKRKELIVYLKAFIQQNPNSIAAYNTLGMAYAAEKKWADASNILQDALKQDPKAIATYKLLAGILSQQGKVADVPALYQRGLDASPDHPELMLELAKHYDSVKDYASAIAAYDNLLGKYPGIDEATNNLAYLLVEHGSAPDRFERAIKLSEHFKDARNPYFVDTYGWVLFKSGKAETAVEILRKAVAVVPDNAEFHHHLGEAYLAAGDKNAAKLALQNSVSLARKPQGFAGIERAKDLLKQVGG